MLSVYDEYSLHGVQSYYKQFSNNYYNPHELSIIDVLNTNIKKYLNKNMSVLDFACGDGLISRYIRNNFNNIIVEGSDPYFNNIYTTYKLSFDDVICGKLIKCYDIIICCYAFHLLDFKKRHDFLTQLSLITKMFIIISPSKKIHIDHSLWTIIENVRINKISIIVIKVKSNH